jgi:hypothetical protein
MKRCVLLFSGHYMTAYLRAGSQCTVQGFAPDEHGKQAFSEFLRAHPRLNFRLLTDVIEEEFVRDTLPRVYGQDRKAVYERNLNRYFRESRYRHVHLLGRPRGRHQEVLLSAITNNELLKPWLQRLQDAKAAVEGIYSAPLVGEDIVSRLGANKGYVLLVSQQGAQSLRQGLYLDGRLQLSRQAPLRRAGDRADGQRVAEEVRRARTYLDNRRLIPAGSRLRVLVVANSEGHRNELLQDLVSDDRLGYEILERARVARHLKLPKSLPTDYSSALYACFLLNQSWPANHYAGMQERHYFLHKRAGEAGVALAGGALLATLWWGGDAVLDGMRLQTQTETARMHAVQLEEANRRMQSSQEPGLPGPRVLESIVLTARRLQASSQHRPKDLMVPVSRVLDRFPNVVLHRFDWAWGSGERFDMQQGRLEAVHVPGAPAGTVVYEAAYMKLDLVNYQNRYAQAIALAGEVISALRKLDHVVQVKVLHMPLDIDADKEIRGNTGTSVDLEGDAKASLELVVVARMPQTEALADAGR